MQVEDCDRVYPIADEDISRQNEVKTSSVHFLRFELTPVMMAALARGAAIFAGVEHPAYTVASISPACRDSRLPGRGYSPGLASISRACAAGSEPDSSEPEKAQGQLSTGWGVEPRHVGQHRGEVRGGHPEPQGELGEVLVH